MRRNIKVLNDLPASQLIPVMNYFAASMGRRCNFCHVNNNGQWDYAADTKPEKNTAREMIKMVLDINKTNFRDSCKCPVTPAIADVISRNRFQLCHCRYHRHRRKSRRRTRGWRYAAGWSNSGYTEARPPCRPRTTF